MPNIFDIFNSEPKRKGQRDEVLPQENDGAPDSNRPSGLCPRCGKQSSFEIADLCLLRLITSPME